MIACSSGGITACLADPMVPCAGFEPGEAADNTMVRALPGTIAAIAMQRAFVLRHMCTTEYTDCAVQKQAIEELSAGSQVMLTTDGQYLVGIDHDDGDVWTYTFGPTGQRIAQEPTYTDKTRGPAQLVMGLRNSSLLVVRDYEGHLGIYQPRATVATRIAPELDYIRLVAVGERHIVVRVVHAEDSQTLYLVDVERNPDRPSPIATGDFSRVVFGPADRRVVLSVGRGNEASVLVFDIEQREVIDAFAGDLISSGPAHRNGAVEELPGLHAISPDGETLAYRTTSGSLAIRTLDSQNSCLVRNTNRLGPSARASRGEGNHAVAGFSADGIVYAQYTIGTAESFVYAYDPRAQQITPLGREASRWHLAAVPGSIAADPGLPASVWAVGVHDGVHASIGAWGAQGPTIGRELTFIPLDDPGIWAIDTRDQLIDAGDARRALSVRRTTAPRRSNQADGQLRFDPDPEAQVVHYTDQEHEHGRLRLPLTGRLCLTTGVPGSWAYRCGDSTGTHRAFTTDSGRQEQTNDPNVRPEFDPPFPDQSPPSTEESTKRQPPAP